MLAQDYLNQCLDYSSCTGLLTWKVRPRDHFETEGAFKRWNKIYPGSTAGSACVCGKYGKKYSRIYVDNKKYFAHRIAWVMLNGEIDGQVDHIDGDGLNNRYDNLRVVSCRDNHRNRKVGSNNKTGVLGVRVRGLSWRVTIGSVTIGTFKDFFEAVCARKSAELAHGFHANHGTSR